MTSPTGTRQKSSLTRLYRTYWQFAVGNRPLVVLFVSSLVAAQAVRLCIPYFFGQAVNALQSFGNAGLRTAGWCMALIFGACVLSWALHGPGRVVERFVALKIRERFADALYNRAVSLPMSWHEGHHSGDTVQRVNKATGALFEFSQNQFIYLQNVVSLVGPVAALLVISVGTGTAAMLSYLVIAVVLVRFDRAMVRLREQQLAAEGRYAAGIADCLGNIATVLALRLQTATRGIMAGKLADVSAPMRQGIVVNETKWCVIDLLNAGIRCGLVVLYAWLAWQETGALLLGSAVMVYQYAQQSGSVVSAMAGNFQDLLRYQTDFGSADHVMAANDLGAPLAVPPTLPVAAPATVALPATGRAAVPANWREIGISELHFYYRDKRKGEPTLRDVALDLRRGSRVALVGESGSGKSTLLRILAGLYEPNRSSFRIDGAACPNLKDLAPIATLIPQDPEIFETSVGRNITMEIEHRPADVHRACDLACFTPVVDQLPSGLETGIAERGVNLSGGQKQRLALARGILAARDSTLILLDEPTSSIDPVTEARIYDNLLGEFPDACVVSSIHRLHLLPRFDIVVLMAEGRVIDVGPTDDMLARHPGLRGAANGAAPHHEVPANGESIAA